MKIVSPDRARGIGRGVGGRGYDRTAPNLVEVEEGAAGGQGARIDVSGSLRCAVWRWGTVGIPREDMRGRGCGCGRGESVDCTLCMFQPTGGWFGGDAGGVGGKERIDTLLREVGAAVPDDGPGVMTRCAVTVFIPTIAL